MFLSVKPYRMVKINEHKFRLYNCGLVTILIARTGQVHRLYKSIGQLPPLWLMDICAENEKNKLNYC